MDILFTEPERKQRKTKSRKVSASAKETKLIYNVLNIINERDYGDFWIEFMNLFIEIDTNYEMWMLENLVKQVNKSKNVVWNSNRSDWLFAVYLGTEKELAKDIEELADKYLSPEDKKKLLTEMWK